MPHDRPEIEQWSAERGYPPAAIEKILLRLDQFDSKSIAIRSSTPSKPASSTSIL